MGAAIRGAICREVSNRMWYFQKSLDGYVRTTNDILFNLVGTIGHVEQANEQQRGGAPTTDHRRHSPLASSHQYRTRQ